MKSPSLQTAFEHLKEASAILDNKNGPMSFHSSTAEWQCANALRLAVASILDELEAKTLTARTIPISEAAQRGITEGLTYGKAAALQADIQRRTIDDLKV